MTTVGTREKSGREALGGESRTHRFRVGPVRQKFPFFVSAEQRGINRTLTNKDPLGGPEGPVLIVVRCSGRTDGTVGKT